MKKLIFFISFLLFAGIATAQDEAVFTHYYLSPIIINPALAGYSDGHRLQLNARNAWTGFPGAPKTYAVSWNGAIGKTLGLGAMVSSENIASISTFRAQLSYAFRYNVNNFKMAGGFSTEFQQMRIPSSVESDELYQQGDLLLSDAVDGLRIFDASFGFYATYSENTYIGFSLPNLIRTRLDDIVDTQDNTSLLQYYMFNVGHIFKSESLNLTVEPSLLIKKVRDVPFQVDLNVKTTFLDERIITGLSYRTGTGGVLGLLLGTKINSVRFYYSYDVFFGRFQKYNGGSHEVTVAFDFMTKSKDKAEKYRKGKKKKKS